MRRICIKPHRSQDKEVNTVNTKATHQTVHRTKKWTPWMQKQHHTVHRTKKWTLWIQEQHTTLFTGQRKENWIQEQHTALFIGQRSEHCEYKNTTKRPYENIPQNTELFLLYVVSICSHVPYNRSFLYSAILQKKWTHCALHVQHGIWRASTPVVPRTSSKTKTKNMQSWSQFSLSVALTWVLCDL